MFNKARAIKIPRALLPIVIALTATVTLSYCGQDKSTTKDRGLEPDNNTRSTLASSNFLPDNSEPHLSSNRGLILLASARTNHSLAAARAFEEAIQQLLTSPQASHLTQAKIRWRKLFHDLHQLLPLLYLEHKTSSHLQYLKKWRLAISAWPIQPGYIDSYKNYFHSGIVNDINMPISRTILRQQHGRTDKEEVLLGIHAIEYILWGEQETPRTFEHFIALKVLPEKLSTSGIEVNNLANNRRRQLLALQTRILVDDLRALQRQWQSGNSIANHYQKLNQQQRLTAINHSAANYIQHWVMLLTKEQTPKNIDVRLNDFAGNRLEGLKSGLKTITDIYVNHSILLDGKLLKDSDTKQFKQLLNNITTALNEEMLTHNEWTDTTITALTAPMSQAASLLKSSLASPARIEANE